MVRARVRIRATCMSEIETELDGDASWAAGGSGEASIGEASCDPADGGDAPG